MPTPTFTSTFNCGSSDCPICNSSIGDRAHVADCAICQGAERRHYEKAEVTARQRREMYGAYMQPTPSQSMDYIQAQSQLIEKARQLTENTPLGKEYLASRVKINDVPLKTSMTKEQLKIMGYDYAEENAVATADNKLDQKLAEDLAALKLQQKQDAMVAIGDEPTDTTYIAFEKQFDTKGVVYKYVAIKLDNGSWFSSATKQGSNLFNTWNELVVWLVKGPFPTSSVTKLYSAAPTK